MNTIISRPFTVATAISLSVVASSNLGAQENRTIEQTLSFGAAHTRGAYGEEVDTLIDYFPLTYSAQVGKWGFQAQIPHLRVEGLGNVLVNVGGVTRATGVEQTVSSGLGDTFLSATYQMDPIFQEGPFVDLRFDVKIPTADETKSLGTGETDYGAQVDIYQAFSSFNLFGSLGYRWRGESVLFSGLKDSAYGQLGVVAPLNDAVSIGLIYDYRAPATDFVEDSHELLPYISWEISPNWTLSGFAGWGFTDASADVTAIGQLSYRW